jgi:hypothetical protein
VACTVAEEPSVIAGPLPACTTEMLLQLRYTVVALLLQLGRYDVI